MAEKKYQIFVSSTYRDLKNERDRLHKSILKAGCIPVGMEFFPAKDEKQIKYIQAEIDKCDYVVLVVGLQYGSVDDQGVSYTEQEYDYSVNKKKEIIVLIQEETESNHIDKTAETYEKLVAFRDKVTRNRLVWFWKDMADLVEAFHVSLNKAINQSPEAGWIRGGNMQIATDIKMEACSATNPTFFSETEIECVSVIMDYKIDQIDMSLFTPYSSHISKSEMIRYYQGTALPWIFRMARICRLDLRITNPYSFPINNINSEQHLFDETGKEIKIVKLENMISKPPLNPYHRISSVLTTETDSSFRLNPRQPIFLDKSRYFLPDKNQDCTFQRIFYAENITEPIKKEIKIHFRIKKVEYDFNSIIKLVQFLEIAEKFNDLGALQLVKMALGTDRKEKDSCDTQK